MSRMILDLPPCRGQLEGQPEHRWLALYAGLGLAYQEKVEEPHEAICEGKREPRDGSQAKRGHPVQVENPLPLYGEEGLVC